MNQDWLKEIEDRTNTTAYGDDWHCIKQTLEDRSILLAAYKAAMKALGFYADPPKKDEYGEPLSIPDFYSEMDFGDRAREALRLELPQEIIRDVTERIHAAIDAERADAITQHTADLQRENERLKNALTPFVSEKPDSEGVKVSWAHIYEAKQALKHSTPTGLGSPVLALARCSVTFVSTMAYLISIGSVDLSSYNTWESLCQAAQPFIESPELRQMLGVE